MPEKPLKRSGSLLTYLRKLERGLANESVEVPCGSCTACCRDPNFEVDVSVAEAGHYKASRKVDGRFVLDRQADGSCVYLVDGKCTTYHERPRTCRVYDCRYHLFGAPLDPKCTAMVEAVAQWEKFTLPTTEDKVAFVAVSAMVETMQKQHPDMAGLAYVLTSWRKLRDWAYLKVQEFQQI